MRSKGVKGNGKVLALATGRMGLQLTDMGKAERNRFSGGGITSTFLNLLRLRYQVGNLSY